MEAVDAATIARVRSGDRTLRLLVGTQQGCCSLAYRITRNEHDADDVVQGFLRAFRIWIHSTRVISALGCTGSPRTLTRPASPARTPPKRKTRRFARPVGQRPAAPRAARPNLECGMPWPRNEGPERQRADAFVLRHL